MRIFSWMIQFQEQNLISKMELYGKRWMRTFFLNCSNLIKHCLCLIQLLILTQLNKILKIHYKNWLVSIVTNINLVLLMTRFFQVCYQLPWLIMKSRELLVRLFVRMNFSLPSRIIFLPNILLRLFLFNWQLWIQTKLWLNCWNNKKLKKS